MFENTMDTKPLPPFDPESETGQGDAYSSPVEMGDESSKSHALAATEGGGPSLAPSKCPRASDGEFPLHDVFVGPNGLYPGSRWLVYLALAALVYIVLQWLTQQLRAETAGTLTASMAWEISVLLAALLPAFVMARLEQRSLTDFGLPGRQAFGRNFWIGALWGIASLSILMLVLRVAGAYEFGSVALRGPAILKFALYYAGFFLATGVCEEFLFRGYSQWVLTRGMHFWPAAALLSIGFGAVHSENGGESKAGLIAAGLIGFFFCLTLRRTGSLWWAIGFHMSWDWGESFLYSVPDSGGMAPGHLLNSSFHAPAWLTGGTVGPEGSALIFVLLVILWIVFDRTHRAVKYEPR